MYETAITLLSTYRYLIIVPLTAFFGPPIMMIGGVLIKTGFFSFWPAYLCLIAGDLVGDVIWYGVGYFFGDRFVRRFGRFFSITPEGFERTKRVFHKYQQSILFISKITMGLGFALATLVAAGAARVPFRRYLEINFIGEFIWTGFLVGIGYFLGNLYTRVDDAFEWVKIGASMVIVLLLLFGLVRHIRSRVKMPL